MGKEKKPAERQGKRRKKKKLDNLTQQKGHCKSDPGPAKRGCVYPIQRYRIIPVGSY